MIASNKVIQMKYTSCSTDCTVVVFEHKTGCVTTIELKPVYGVTTTFIVTTINVVTMAYDSQPV